MIWEKLNRFTKINEFKSLSEAARKGPISQSTWSRDIHQLETVFGTKLVSRSHNGIKLTEKGKSLLLIIESFKKNLKFFKSAN